MPLSRAVLIAWALLPPMALAQIQIEPASPGLLSRDELRACMAQEDALRARSQRLETVSLSTNEDGAAIALANSALLRESAAGFKDRAARDAYAARSRALDQRIHAHYLRVRELKLGLADLEVAQAANMRACGGRRYLTEDRDAILTERATAPQAASSPR